jgi:hypothetical protein
LFSVDMIRGLCLVEMMANHLPANLLSGYAVETAGFISAAEGFVFLSGFVAGWTSARAFAANRPQDSVARRLRSRAYLLYAVYCTIFTIVTCLAAVGGPHFHEWREFCYFGTQPAAEVWLFGITFLHLPRYLDVFAMYCIFLILTPVVLRQIRAGRQRLVVCLSAALWFLSQVWTLPAVPSLLRFGYFNLLSWQMLFTAGLLIGYRHQPARVHLGFSMPALLACVALCMALFALRHPAPFWRWGIRLPDLRTVAAADKSTLGFLRLLNFAAMAHCLRRLASWLEAKWRRIWLCQKLAELGQHSLQVFSWSIAATFLLFLSGESWRDLPIALQIGLASATTAALWVPAAIHAKWKTRVLVAPNLHPRMSAAESA